jgi:hypothetical protein
MRTPDSALPLLVTALALVAGPALAVETKSAEPAKFSLHVESAEGDEVRIEASSGWLGALIATADIECDGDADGQSRRMMEDLRRQGEGGFHRYRDEDDGDLVIGRRSRGALKLETRGDDGDRAIVEMPWEVAECLMMGIDPPGDLGRRIARGEAKLSIDVREGDDGDRVTLRLE